MKHDPRRLLSFAQFEQKLFERFHGHETHDHYAEEYRVCVRLDNEGIRDYASVMDGLFRYAYPNLLTDDSAANRQQIEIMLMDKFRGSIQTES